MLWAMLHKIHCIQSGCIGPCCIKCTAFNHAAWNPLHSIGMHFTRLHELHFIHSKCMESTAFYGYALAILHKIHCIQFAAWNPLHSIMLHCNHCIQSGTIGPCCMESTAFKHAAWNPLHSIGMLWAMLHKIHCIQSCCMESTALHHAA